MLKISKSPDRHTFQKEGYAKRMSEKGESLNQDYLDMFDDVINQHNTKFEDPATHVNNMEYDLLTTDWILKKVRVSDNYAQNLYAAMCNNDFIPMSVVPILRQDPDKDYWHCSWRHAGGIIADMQEKGDYIDWYCSGIGNAELGNGLDGTVPDITDGRDYVPEGRITDEIRNDLQSLGWVIVPGGDWEKFT